MLRLLFIWALLLLPVSAASACDVFDDLYDQHIQQDRVLFFGELHGNQQMPGLFGDVACEILSQGATLHVGLEIDQESQANLDAFFASGNLGTGLRILLEDNHWQGNSGRSSEDMLLLLQRLYQLGRNHNEQLHVYAFSAKPPERVAKMYENIKSYVENSHSTHHIILSGNLHSQTELGTQSDENYKSVAYRMKESGFDVASYLFRYTGGDVWLCSDGCYTHTLAGGFRQGEYRKPVESSLAFFKHDFEISIGEMKSSPPVFSRQPVETSTKQGIENEK